MCLNGALCSIPFNLKCNMTTFSKKKIDLLTPPQGSSVCARKEYVLKGSIMRKTMNIVFYSYKAYY